MTFTFRPALRERTPIMLGLAGPSRSGKTYSALRVAMGLAKDGTVAMIDTESGRGLQYADRFKYQYTQLGAPFTSERYLDAIESARGIGARVIIVDSASHEHEGPGGMLEQHETELQRMAGDDFKKRDRMTFSAWIKPKAAHNRFVNRLLQMGNDVHFIFCFRAKEKLRIVAGKDPVNEGWTPICSSRFEFEMTSLLVLPEGSQGRPDLAAIASGVRDPLQQYFKTGIQLDEELGKHLAHWAQGAKSEPNGYTVTHWTSPDGLPWTLETPWTVPLIEEGWNAAAEGSERYSAWWHDRPRKFMNAAVHGKTHAALKQLSREADGPAEGQGEANE